VEACSQILLACGGDIERLLDGPADSVAAFVRHTGRLAMLRELKEIPIVMLASHSGAADEVLSARIALTTSAPNLENATWLVYLPQTVRRKFIRDSSVWGGSFDVGAGLVTWNVGDATLGLVNRDTSLDKLVERVSTFSESLSRSSLAPNGDDPSFTSFVPAPPSSSDHAAPSSSDPDEDSPPVSEIKVIGQSLLPANPRIRRH